MSSGFVILIVVIVAVTAAFASGFYFTRRIHHKVTYMLDALEDRETNFRFDEKKFFDRKFNKTLNRLRTFFDHEKAEIAEQEQYYAQMLAQVKTGIVVIDLSSKHTGNIIYCNPSALNILGMATFNNVRQLSIIDKQLEESFCKISTNDELRNSFYNEKGKISISITASRTTLQHKPVKIISINNITGEIAHSEEQSWNKLIRVLTHEIMNTITPIASLSRTLSDELETIPETEHLNRKELKLGLDTIADSSNGLIKFVNTYRSLTRVSAPIKKAFYVHELIEKVIQLTRDQVNNMKAQLTYVEKSEDILLYADENQLAQVIINLIKNALQAEARRIQITAEIDFAETVVITVSNNGRPILKESEEEIFVPFYTTKPEGSGIGLSLSRQIMRLHNGTISLVRSNPQITTFQLHFR